MIKERKLGYKRIKSIFVLLLALVCFYHTDGFVYAAGTGDGSSPENAINIASGLKMESVPSAVTYYEDGNGGTAVYTPAGLGNEDVDIFVLNDMTIEADIHEALKLPNSRAIKMIINGTNDIKGASSAGDIFGVALKADYCTVTIEISENASLDLIAGENLSEDAWTNVGYASAYGTLHIVNNGILTIQEGNYTNNGSHCEAINVSDITISGNGITNVWGQLNATNVVEINTVGTVNLSSMNEVIEIIYGDVHINSGTVNIESKGEKALNILEGRKIIVADSVSGSIISPNGQVKYIENHSENFNVYRISGTGNLLFRVDEENSELYVSEDAGVSWASLGIVKGNDGVGIQDVSINETGELIVKLTDGTIYNMGNIHGEDGADGKDGEDGKDGTDGKDGEDGKDGTDGKDGEDGKDGADGKDGEDGKDGADGKDGTDGKDGADGKDGIDGINGVNGKDGKNGVDGKNGLDGKDGVDGKDGKDGADGKDGVGVQSIEMNKDGNFIFTMTDGSVIEVENTMQKEADNGMAIPAIFFSICAFVCSSLSLIKVSKK